ncbi:MAG TPA: biotin carboxylase N-terminal domain-containing protein [SAR86 cluster bacterium]|jgi:propionyl-CoA carboxylase alpha chain|nr:biotin carboxylase N-terminal domain-containing protein [SAR86 cluster bacterium]|tara:strand:+ start:1820 stop:3739 length:1920 start_codon:yes stop_codon:yes gene_type:complete
MTFHKLLIANRGEIACRIIKSAHEMGIACVAVYTNADSESPFVRQADEAIKLSDSYLNGKEIIEAAIQTGAQAIHPGYGFLSENAKFSRDVLKAGLIWVGPSSRVITSMGDKLKAKDIAEKAGVPTLPMTTDPKKANTIGYPILIKAAAGGGGKGMRIVESKKDLKESLLGAQREAMTGFGDDRVFIERYVASSRHIEIQILGDSHGNVVHLGERECSIQRRHQKIIEESPSPRVNPEMREAMGDAAIKLAKKLKYESAGTVEFLVDDKTGEFWFLEVNTRLQVEHPVTEEVTGKDLVYEQLRIARGEELGYEQEDVSWEGSSIEARLYAEDPANEFLPATGTLIAYETDEGIDARWDTGIEQGSVIGTDFDPMLAKVIAKGKNRTDAANKLALALQSLHIGGVTTNRDFLVASLRSKHFHKGQTTSDFIEKAKPQRSVVLKGQQLEQAITAAALWIQGENRNNASLLKEAPSGWRNSRLPRQKISFEYSDKEVNVTYKANRDGSFDLNEDTKANILKWTTTGIDLEVNNTRFFSKVTRKNDDLVVHGPWGDALLKILPRFTLPGAELQAGGLVAPMPGKVIDLKVKVGSKVKKGDTLVILEAMKMEHQVKAIEDGKVTQVLIKKDDQLENGALLMIVD